MKLNDYGYTNRQFEQFKAMAKVSAKKKELTNKKPINNEDVNWLKKLLDNNADVDAIVALT
jgi:hypothetical protein